MAQEEEAAQPLFAVLRGIADVIARLLTGATTPLTNFTKGMGKFALDTCKDVLKGTAHASVQAIKGAKNRSIGHGDYGLIKEGKFDRHMAHEKFDMVDIKLNKTLDNKQKHELNKRLRKCGIRATLSGDNVLRCSEQHKSIVERYVKAIESPAPKKENVVQKKVHTQQLKNSDNQQPQPDKDEKVKHKGKGKESPAAKKKVKHKGKSKDEKVKHKGKSKEAATLKKKGKHRAPKHRTNFATCAAAGTALHAKPKTAAPKAKVKVKPPAAKLPLLKR
ncbi:hypothetical protein [Fannyhessea vaginae]|uniref:hypothetical protein n=1 Tax=Fannyhessea vaginae TaxID=82135 RepID=UPI00076FC9AF|nr:hypothetical protein [Fannyhessea vaginae]KXG89827.1 hypothetical protein HMPREF3232_00755 [Fannyhessea vaginae]